MKNDTVPTQELEPKVNAKVEARRAETRPPLARGRHKTARAKTRESFADFTQVLTHRIGSLLSSIEGYTDLVLSSLNTKEDRQNAFRILEGVSRIEGVLHDLSHYQEALDLDPEPMDVSKVLNSLIGVLADSELHQLKLDLHVPASARIQADLPSVRQGLLSVLRNAFDVTQQSGLPVTLTVDLPVNTSSVRFRIFNPVPLEDERIRTQMFKPFYTTKAANMGLGLTMARRIFRAHRGDVTLTSAAVEAGTEISCTLPLISD